jgi:hypothetical protein
MPNPPTKPSPEALATAEQELEILDVLAHGVTTEIASLSKKPQSLGHIDANELALIGNRHARLKFFTNFETGAERDYYGLQNASEKDFSPTGMAGFVLSHSLKRYLKETADALELIHLPIRDFEEFRGDLLNTFGISNQFKRKKGAVPSIRNRMDWLRALDVALAHAAAIRLQENLVGALGVSPRIAGTIRTIASDLLSAEIVPEVRSLHMSGLAARVVGSVSEVELRDQEDQARVEFPIVEKTDNQRRRNKEAALERELNRIQRQAERKLVSPRYNRDHYADTQRSAAMVRHAG